MALQFDGVTVGAMMYNGVTIGEAMIDGQIVYRSVIRVTPAAPTFHDGEPWYTLPTVEGVTYSVAGTPGYNASVTVTATAQPGYELVGTASWSHTYGPPPRYTASDSLTGTLQVSRSSWTTIATHTVSGGGPSSGTWSVNWTTNYAHADTTIRVLRNGATIATNTRQSSLGLQSATIPEINLANGDSLQFQAIWDGLNSGSGRYIGSWSWSLS